MPPKKKIIAEPVVEPVVEPTKVTKSRAKKTDTPVVELKSDEPTVKLTVKKSKKAEVEDKPKKVEDKPKKVEKKPVKQKKVVEKNIDVNETVDTNSLSEEFNILKSAFVNVTFEIAQLQACIEMKQQEKDVIIQKIILLNDKTNTQLDNNNDKNLESIFSTRHSKEDNGPSKIIISSDSESSDSSSDESDESMLKNVKTKKLGLFGKKAKSLSSDSDSDSD
jgi:hypothetical protein